MKKYIFFVLLTASMASCKKDKDHSPEHQKGITDEMVLELAKKYSLQDSIAAGYTPVFGSKPPEALYPEISATDIDRYFAQWRTFADDINEMHRFVEARKKVSSLDEYYALLEAHPILFKDMVEQAGGMSAFLKEKERRYKFDNACINEDDGCIVFVNALNDYGTPPGKLIYKARK